MGQPSPCLRRLISCLPQPSRPTPFLGPREPKTSKIVTLRPTPSSYVILYPLPLPTPRRHPSRAVATGRVTFGRSPGLRRAVTPSLPPDVAPSPWFLPGTGSDIGSASFVPQAPPLTTRSQENSLGAMCVIFLRSQGLWTGFVPLVSGSRCRGPRGGA